MGQDFNQTMALRIKEQFLEELRGVNESSARFGLCLSEQGMRELAQARTLALREHGRVELGVSAVKSIADGFCDSPYLLQEDYEATLMELVDAFYYFKNACGEQLTDEELISAMRARYDAYDGSVEAVIGTSLEALCRARRFGIEEDDDREDDDDERGDE
ncbi:MAG: DUF6323 family protein [Eubacteriales bacterium]|nr:DUF6323 family protein [Eubacteriales bacterium]